MTSAMARPSQELEDLKLLLRSERQNAAERLTAAENDLNNLQLDDISSIDELPRITDLIDDLGRRVQMLDTVSHVLSAPGRSEVPRDYLTSILGVSKYDLNLDSSSLLKSSCKAVLLLAHQSLNEFVHKGLIHEPRVWTHP